MEMLIISQMLVDLYKFILNVEMFAFSFHE
jgi:hypothetical protein